MADPASRPGRALADTSVIIDLAGLDHELLPEKLAISAVTLAELSAGPSSAQDAAERSVRQDRLQRTETTFDVVPFDAGAARAYARVFTAVREQGRQPRRRQADLMIAATALAHGLPLVTRNADDFRGLGHLIEILVV